MKISTNTSDIILLVFYSEDYKHLCENDETKILNGTSITTWQQYNTFTGSISPASFNITQSYTVGPRESIMLSSVFFNNGTTNASLKWTLFRTADIFDIFRQSMAADYIELTAMLMVCMLYSTSKNSGIVVVRQVSFCPGSTGPVTSA